MSVSGEPTRKCSTADPADPQLAESLNKALSQNRSAKGLLEAAASELSSVNEVLKEELTKQAAPPEIENAIGKSEAVEVKVLEVSGKLDLVNRALAGEVKDRVLLEHRFAAICEQEAAARHAAFHDSLTGLPNRMLFHDRLEHGIAQAGRHGWSLAVMFIDLDDFKIVNDSYGHAAGDTVLKAIAGRLKQNTRNDDTVSRFGGDEFLYLLMETGDDATVRSIAEKLVAAIGAPCDLGIPKAMVTVRVKASIGIAIYPKHGLTADKLIISADAAMYRAKQDSGRCAFADK